MKNLQLRLAMRVEGAKWNAYAAKPDTMVDAIWLGSIALRFIEHNKQRKQAFLALMQDALGEQLAEITGAPVTWNKPSAAPEHERGGSA